MLVLVILQAQDWYVVRSTGAISSGCEVPTDREAGGRQALDRTARERQEDVWEGLGAVFQGRPARRNERLSLLWSRSDSLVSVV